MKPRRAATDPPRMSSCPRRRAIRDSIAEAEAAPRSERWELPGVTLLDLWHASDTDAERRELLCAVLERLDVRRTEARGRGAGVSDRVKVTEVTENASLSYSVYRESPPRKK